MRWAKRSAGWIGPGRRETTSRWRAGDTVRLNGPDECDGCSLVNAAKVTEGCGDGHRLPDPDGYLARVACTSQREREDGGSDVERSRMRHSHRRSERKTIDVSAYHVTAVNVEPIPLFKIAVTTNSLFLKKFFSYFCLVMNIFFLIVSVINSASDRGERWRFLGFLAFKNEVCQPSTTFRNFDLQLRRLLRAPQLNTKQSEFLSQFKKKKKDAVSKCCPTELVLVWNPFSKTDRTYSKHRRGPTRCCRLLNLISALKRKMQKKKKRKKNLKW